MWQQFQTAGNSFLGVFTLSPLGDETHLKQWFPKCGPWTSSRSITWDLVRNINSWAPPRPTQSEILGVGHSDLCLTNPPDHSDAHWSFKITNLKFENQYVVSPCMRRPLIFLFNMELTQDLTLQGEMELCPSVQTLEVLNEPGKTKRCGQVLLYNFSKSRVDPNIFWPSAIHHAWAKLNYLVSPFQ